MSRDSRSLRRNSRISFAWRCFVASSDAFILSSERFVISKSAILGEMIGVGCVV